MNKDIFLCFFIVIFFIPHKAHTQEMNSIDILHNLNVCQDLLKELHQQELPHLQKKENFVKLTKVVSQGYESIRIELIMISNENGSASEVIESLYCRIDFKINDSEMVFSSLYCADKLRQEDVKKTIESHKVKNACKWNAQPEDSFLYSGSVTEYLAIADAIAKRAHYCVKGDDYRPGYFSEIIITDEDIILSQVNHMNAKSLDHKNDYSLRKLEFTIPLILKERNVSRYDYRIGDMLIEFSDSSSPNNKSCGEAIKEQIEKEKFAYEKK